MSFFSGTNSSDEDEAKDATTADETRISSSALSQNSSSTAMKVHVMIMYTIANPSEYSVYSFNDKGLETSQKNTSVMNTLNNENCHLRGEEGVVEEEETGQQAQHARLFGGPHAGWHGQQPRDEALGRKEKH